MGFIGGNLGIAKGFEYFFFFVFSWFVSYYGLNGYKE